MRGKGVLDGESHENGRSLDTSTNENEVALIVSAGVSGATGQRCPISLWIFDFEMKPRTLACRYHVANTQSSERLSPEYSKIVLIAS